MVFARVIRVPYERALKAPATHRHNFLETYVNDLPAVVDIQVIRDSRVNLGVDPLGGASVAYWEAIATRHNLNLAVVNRTLITHSFAS